MANSTNRNITTRIAVTTLMLSLCLAACTQTPTVPAAEKPGEPAAENKPVDVPNANSLVVRDPGSVTNSPISVIGDAAARSAAALPVPKTGTATATGVLYDKVSGLPVINRTVLLAPVQENSAYFIDTASSPTVQTDAFGRFIFSNIEARPYAIVIGDPFGKYTIAPDLKIANQVRVWSIEVNKINDIGDLIVDWSVIK